VSGRDVRTLDPTDECPYCEHCIGDHTSLGCEEDWQWNGDGIATVEGCPCNLTLGRAR
jgi:hypothetical protein